MSVEKTLFTRPASAPPVETCWALLGPSRRPLTCAIYRTDVGLEVRVGYGEHPHLCTRRANELGIARSTAIELRDAVNSSGIFEELYEI